MNSPSTISLLNADNTVTQIYCHLHGELSNTGILLANYYNTLDKVTELVSVGDISYLGKNLEITKSYHTHYNDELHCIKYNDIKDYFVNYEQQNYNYLFIDNKWMVECDESNSKWRDLNVVLKEIEYD